MNKQCYRLVFNKVRAMLVAVAETVYCAGGGELRNRVIHSDVFRSGEFPQRVVVSSAWSIRLAVRMLCMLSALTLSKQTLAAVIADSTAAQTPIVTTTAGGQSLINITAPNQQGLSDNRFTELNIDKGAFFNNSTVSYAKPGGGYVALNPQLGATPAKVILNQVIGAGPSSIRGALEVLGRKADLLIVNPNGVTLNGVNAINTDRLTISTGHLDMSRGLPMLNVNQGTVTIDGEGVATDGLSYFDIVARSIALHAPVGPSVQMPGAAEIQLITGLNSYDTAAHTYQKQVNSATNAPSFAIDGTAAGSMYGQLVKLVSTEAGLGVRYSGVVKAAGDIQIQANGDISLTRQVAAGNNVALAARNIAVAGVLADSGNINLNGNNVTLGSGSVDDGLQAVNGTVNFNATGDLQVHNHVSTSGVTATINGLTTIDTGAGLHSTGTNVLTTGQLNNAGAIVAQGDVYLRLGHGTSSNSGQIQGSQVSLQRLAGTDVVNFNNRLSGMLTSTLGMTTLSVDQLDNQGMLQSAGQGNYMVTGALHNAGNLTSSSAGVQLTSGSIVNRGAIAAQGQVQAIGALVNIGAEASIQGDSLSLLQADSVSNQDGARITAVKGDAVFVVAKNFSNSQGGQIQAGRDIRMTVGGMFANTDKDTLLQALNHLSITASEMSNNTAQIAASKSVVLNSTTGDLSNQAGGNISGQMLTLHAAGDINNQGDAHIVAEQDINLIAAKNLSNRGQIQAGRNVRVAASGVFVNAGKDTLLQAANDLSVTASDISNSAARIVASKSVVLTSTSGGLSNQTGGDISGQTLALHAAGDISNDAHIVALQDMDLITVRNFGNGEGGQIQAGRDMRVKAGGVFVNTDKDTLLQASNDLSVTANDINNSAARIIATNSIELTGTTGDLSNQMGGSISGQTLTLYTVGDISNQDAHIVAKKDVRLAAARNLSNSKRGRIQAGHDLHVTAGATLVNSDTGSSLHALRHLTVKASSISNNAAQIVASQHLDLTATKGDISNQAKGSIFGQAIAMNVAGNIFNTDATLQSVGDMTLTGQNIYNREGGKMTGQTIAITAAKTLHNTSILHGSDRTILVSDSLNNSGKVLAGRLDLNTARYVNPGSLESTGDATLTMTKGGDLDVTTERILPVANGTLNLNANHVTIDAESSNPGSIVVTAQGNFVNNQSLVSGGDVSIVAGGMLDNSDDALLWARRDVTLTAGKAINNGSQIQAMRDVYLTANTITNRTGGIEAGRDAWVDAQTFTNQGVLSGSVVAGKKMEYHQKTYIYDANWRADEYSIAVNLPTLDGSALVVKQAVLQAGNNLYLNQRGQKNQSGTVANLGSLIAAGKNIHINGNIDNTSLTDNVSVLDYLHKSAVITLDVVPTAALFHTSLGGRLAKKFTTTYALLDYIFANYLQRYSVRDGQGNILKYVTTRDDKRLIWGVYYAYRSAMASTLQTINTPMFNQIMSVVFGPEWRADSCDSLSRRWEAFKNNSSSTPRLSFYANKQAQLTAGGNVKQDAHSGYVRNGGKPLSNGNNQPLMVKIGDKEVTTIAGSVPVQWNLNNLLQAIDPSPVLALLIKNTHLFTLNVPELSGHVPSAITALTPVTSATVPAIIPATATTPNIRPLYITKLPFIDQNQFYGSQYFFQNIGHNPQTTVATIGDSYFEHQLIHQSIQQTIGHFLASSHNYSDATLVKRLIDNAGALQAQLGLVVGQPLTAAQQAALSKDIVWYVTTTIDGQQVLTPQVYLSSVTLTAADRGGAMIAAQGQVEIAANEDGVSNVNGVIKGRGGVKMTSQGSVTNTAIDGVQGGVSSTHGDVSIRATGDVRHSGAHIMGKNVDITADGSIHIATGMRYDVDGSLVSGRSGQVNAGGTVMLYAGKDLYLTGADLTGDTLRLKARNLNLNDVHEVSSDATQTHTFADSNVVALGSDLKTVQSSSATSVGSTIKSKNLVLDVAHDVTLTGGEINADNVSGKVGGNMIVKARQDVEHTDTREVKNQLVFSAAAGAGGQEAIASYGTIDGVDTRVGGPLVEKKQVGIGRKSSVGRKAIESSVGTTSGLNASTGFEHTELHDTLDTVTHRNAQFNLSKGKLSVGGTFDLGGADINKNNADADLSVTAAEVISAKYVDSARATSHTSTTRLQNRYEAHSAIVDVATTIGGDVNIAQSNKSIDPSAVVAQSVTTATNLAFGDLAGVSSSIAIGNTTTSSITSTTQENMNHIGGRLSLTSTSGDITLNGVSTDTSNRKDVKGNTVQDAVGGQLSLHSVGKVNIGAAKSTSENSTKSLTNEVNMSFSASCSAQGCGTGVAVGVSGGVDDAHTLVAHYSNSHLKIDHLTAKEDVNLAGAVITGKPQLDIGGNLNITSIQDTSTMTHTTAKWDASIGASVNTTTVVAPTVNVVASGGQDWDNAKIVAEQSGIDSDGLSGAVRGDVKLTGAHIVDSTGASDLQVDGKVIGHRLTDTQEKDGGSGGGGGGINKLGLANVSLSASRVDQIHYTADHQATIAGVNINAVRGNEGALNYDATQQTVVTKDENIAGFAVGTHISDPRSKKKDTLPNDPRKNKGHVENLFVTLDGHKTKVRQGDEDKSSMNDSVHRAFSSSHVEDTAASGSILSLVTKVAEGIHSIHAETKGYADHVTLDGHKINMQQGGLGGSSLSRQSTGDVHLPKKAGVVVQKTIQDDKYNSRLIVQVGDDSVTAKVAQRLYQKHAENSILVKRNVDGGMDTLEGNPFKLNGKTKIQLVGHGDDTEGGSQTLGGMKPGELVNDVINLPQAVMASVAPEITKVTLVGCNTAGCLPAKVKDELHDQSNHIETKGYIGKLDVTLDGHKINVQRGGLGKPALSAQASEDGMSVKTSIIPLTESEKDVLQDYGRVAEQMNQNLRAKQPLLPGARGIDDALQVILPKLRDSKIKKTYFDAEIHNQELHEGSTYTTDSYWGTSSDVIKIRDPFDKYNINNKLLTVFGHGADISAYSNESHGQDIVYSKNTQFDVLFKAPGNKKMVLEEHGLPLTVGKRYEMDLFKSSHQHDGDFSQWKIKNPLADEINAAKLIQKNWRDFASYRKQDSVLSREIAKVIGKSISSVDDFYESYSSGKIIAQLNGMENNPLSGHSSFYVDKRHKELLTKKDEEVKKTDSDFIAKYPHKTHKGDIRAYISTIRPVRSQQEYVEYSLSKKGLFVLDDWSHRVFDDAFHEEASYFSKQPYSYGLHYNCNTFVCRVLRRISKKAPINLIPHGDSFATHKLPKTFESKAHDEKIQDLKEIASLKKVSSFDQQFHSSLDRIFREREKIKLLPVQPDTHHQEPAGFNQILQLHKDGKNYYTRPYDAMNDHVPDGNFVFVIMHNAPCQVFCGNKRRIDGHTSLSFPLSFSASDHMDFGKVLFAGELGFVNGKLTSWNNGSGHYQPDPELAKDNLLPWVRVLLPFEQYQPTTTRGRVLGYETME